MSPDEGHSPALTPAHPRPQRHEVDVDAALGGLLLRPPPLRQVSDVAGAKALLEAHRLRLLLEGALLDEVQRGASAAHCLGHASEANGRVEEAA